MQRVVMVLGLFLALCIAIFFVGAPDEEGAIEAPNPALTKLKSSVSNAKNAERALDSNNYGEAQAHIAALQEELGQLVFLLAEKE
jgi:hypothetical protein